MSVLSGCNRYPATLFCLFCLSHCLASSTQILVIISCSSSDALTLSSYFHGFSWFTSSHVSLICVPIYCTGNKPFQYIAINLDLQIDEVHRPDYQLMHHSQPEQTALPCPEKFHPSTLQHQIDGQLYNRQHG